MSLVVRCLKLDKKVSLVVGCPLFRDVYLYVSCLFSMEGSVPRLREIIELKKKYKVSL